MIYNKRQRHLIYKKMLKNLPKMSYGYYSLCFVLMKLIDSNNIFFNFKIPEEFEELLSFKPQNKTNHDYWFHPCDLKTREIVLEFCIEMTKS